MINSILYIAPSYLVETNNLIEVIYTNSYNKDINLKYCMLRSDLVIFTENNNELEEWCTWYQIPFKVVTDVSASLLDGIYKITIIDSKNNDILNSIFSLLRKKTKEIDLTIFANCLKNPGIKMALALGGN